MDKLEENFQKVGPKRNYFKDWYEQKFFKSNNRLYTVKICKMYDRTKFWRQTDPEKFLDINDPETLFGRPFKAELVPVEWGTRRS